MRRTRLSARGFQAPRTSGGEGRSDDGTASHVDGLSSVGSASATQLQKKFTTIPLAMCRSSVVRRGKAVRREVYYPPSHLASFSQEADLAHGDTHVSSKITEVSLRTDFLSSLSKGVPEPQAPGTSFPAAATTPLTSSFVTALEKQSSHAAATSPSDASYPSRQLFRAEKDDLVVSAVPARLPVALYEDEEELLEEEGDTPSKVSICEGPTAPPLYMPVVHESPENLAREVEEDLRMSEDTPLSVHCSVPSSYTEEGGPCWQLAWEAVQEAGAGADGPGMWVDLPGHECSADSGKAGAEILASFAQPSQRTSPPSLSHAVTEMHVPASVVDEAPYSFPAVYPSSTVRMGSTLFSKETVGTSGLHAASLKVPPFDSPPGNNANIVMPLETAGITATENSSVFPNGNDSVPLRPCQTQRADCLRTTLKRTAVSPESLWQAEEKPTTPRVESANVNPPSSASAPLSAQSNICGRRRTLFTLASGPPVATAVLPAMTSKTDAQEALHTAAAPVGNGEIQVNATDSAEALGTNESACFASMSKCEHIPNECKVTAPMRPDTFYDLPREVGQYFEAQRGIKKLYPWQHDVLTRDDVRSGNNFVYSLPTSGGKTLVAEITLLRCVLTRGKSCFFVVPFVSLAEEKTIALLPLGDKFEFLVDGHYGSNGRFPLPRSPSIYICTIEKANSVLNYLIEEGRTSEVGAVVVDELHMVSEPRRGATLELFLSKLLFLSSSPTREEGPLQLMGMSATVANLSSLARWMRAACYEGTYRPVPLHQYSVIDGMVLRDGEHNERNLNGRNEVEQLLELSTEVPEASVLVFCASRKQCVDTAIGIVRYLAVTATRSASDAMQADAPAPGNVHLQGCSRPTDEAAVLRTLLSDLHSIAHHEATQLAEVVPYGVAFHHGGLLAEERLLVETAYRSRHIRILCCTSTLAAGVNLPARRVILKSPYVGRDFLTKSRYLQMCGRAGRAGLDAFGESFLLLSKRDRIRGSRLMQQGLEPCTSQMLEDLNQFSRAVMECVGVGLIASDVEADAWGRHLLCHEAMGPIDAAISSAMLTKSPHLNPGDVVSGAYMHSDSCASNPLPASISACSVGTPTVSEQDHSLTTPVFGDGCCPPIGVSSRVVGVSLRYALDGLIREGFITHQEERKTQCPPTKSAARVTEYENSCADAESITGVDSGRSDGMTRPMCTFFRVTQFGASAVRSCFAVEEAILVKAELVKLLHTGLILIDDLHLCYFLTPLREVGDCDWGILRDMLCRLNDTRQRIAELIGVDEYFINQRAMGLGGPSHAPPVKEEDRRLFFTARRFFVALMLADILAEVPIQEVEERFQVSRGQLQSLMRSASMFSSSITSFCHAMEWYSLEAVLSSFVKRLGFGVKPDLVPLMEIRGVQSSRARALWNAGFRDPTTIAASDPEAMVQKVKEGNPPDSKAAKFFTKRSALMLIREANVLLQTQINAKKGELRELTSRGHVN